MDKRRSRFAVVALFWILLFSACASPTQATRTQSPDAIYTSAAQTVLARFTLSAGETAVAQLTQLASQPSATPTALVLPPASSATSPPQTQVTPIPASPTHTFTPPPLPCDWVQFVSDVSVRENAIFFPGSAFTKTWRIKNIGSCTWTSAYSLVFVRGDLMGEGSALALPSVVRPGEQVDVSVDLTAPSSPGVYRGEWMLRSPSGALFGSGDQGGVPFSVQIQVVPMVDHDHEDVAYDFALNYCRADWHSGSGALICPGSSDDPGGSVLQLDRPLLETGREDEIALWTRPDQSGAGWVSGQYPRYWVKDGDHFVAEIGCLQDSPGCDVIFQLDYLLEDGLVRNLGVWREYEDGLTTEIDVDLSPLAGSQVQFILRAANYGEPEDANAFWLVPHIHNLTLEAELVLTWHRDGGVGAVCEELKIYRVGGNLGQARATSCKGDRQDLGIVRLTDEEVRRVMEMVDRLENFSAETYQPSAGEPLTTWLSFTGLGDEDATNADILALQSLAEQLYSAVAR